MKSKNIIVLAVVLLVLVGLIVFKKSQEKPVTIVDQVKLAQLVPDGLTKGDVAKIELYRGSSPDKKLVLVREEGGDTWRVATQFNAPADATAIDEFVGKIIDTKGEPRATANADADYDAYDLSDAKGFHVVGYKKDSNEAAFHVLTGKSPSFGQTFVRTATGKEIFVSDVDFRRDAGVTDTPAPGMPGAPAPAVGSAGETPIPATKWVKKEIVNIAKEEVASLTVKTPDKQFAVERREKPAPAQPAGSEGTAGATPPKPEFEWTLTSGGPGASTKVAGIENLVRAFGPLNATDIVDPAKKAEYGLEPATFVCTIKSDKQAEPIVIEGGRPDPKGNAYLRVASGKDDVVYTIAGPAFDRVFPKGTTLFDLPAVGLVPDTIDRVELSQPDGKVIAERKDKTWTVVEPKANLTVQASTLDGVARSLAAWRAADYSDLSLADAGLETPERTVTFTAGPATTHTIAFGKPQPGYDAFYVRFDGGDKVYTMTRSDYDAIFVKPKNLFELALMDVLEANVKTVRFDGKDGKYSVERDGSAWKLTVGGATEDADGEAVDAVVSSIASLQADEIFFDKAALEQGPFEHVTVVTTDKVEHVLTFAPKDATGYPLTVSSKNAVFHVSSEDANTLLPSPDFLRKKAEPTPGEGSAGAPHVATPMPPTSPMELGMPHPSAAAPVTVTPMPVAPPMNVPSAKAAPAAVS